MKILSIQRLCLAVALLPSTWSCGDKAPIHGQKLRQNDDTVRARIQQIVEEDTILKKIRSVLKECNEVRVFWDKKVKNDDFDESIHGAAGLVKDLQNQTDFYVRVLEKAALLKISDDLPGRCKGWWSEAKRILDLDQEDTIRKKIGYQEGMSSDLAPKGKMANVLDKCQGVRKWLKIAFPN